MAVDRMRLMHALTTIAADPPPVADLSDQLCRACVHALPVDGVGVSVITGDDPTAERVLLGASNAAGRQIEHLQFDLGEGPCISASRDAQPVLVPDVQGDEASQRWPMFSRAVVGLGLAAVFAFPLQVGAIGMGVLDCHRIRAGPLAEVTDALIVADALAVALLVYQIHTGAGLDEHQADIFDASSRRHAEVHQATGRLAAELDLSTTEALARLRGYAFSHSRTLPEVATDILTGTLHLPADKD